MKNRKTGKELTKSHDTNLQTTESLPVLAAFSDFIKEEQRRSRNRMLIMGFLFTIMIIVVIGAGVFVGTAFYNQVHSDLRQTKSDLNSYHIKSEIEKSRTEEKLSQIQALASNIAHNISQQEQKLQSTQKSFNSNKESYQQELADMKQVIDSLSLENKKLKNDSEQTNIKLPELTAQINDLLSIITNPVVLPTEKPLDDKPVLPETVNIETTNTTAVTKAPEAIKDKTDLEINEPTEITNDTSSLELSVGAQGDDDDIMMLLPTLE